jgi:hypothetical protein
VPARKGLGAGLMLTAMLMHAAQPSRRRTEHVLEAERDLAHQIARDGGVETPAVQRARAAVAHARSA